MYKPINVRVITFPTGTVVMPYYCAISQSVSQLVSQSNLYDCQPVSQLDSQSVSKLVSQSVNHLISRSIQSIIHSFYQTVSQSFSQSIDQSINQSFIETINQPINHSVILPVNQSINLLVLSNECRCNVSPSNLEPTIDGFSAYYNKWAFYSVLTTFAIISLCHYGYNQTADVFRKR